jgi:hypothetical protein
MGHPQPPTGEAYSIDPEILLTGSAVGQRQLANPHYFLSISIQTGVIITPEELEYTISLYPAS